MIQSAHLSECLDRPTRTTLGLPLRCSIAFILLRQGLRISFVTPGSCANCRSPDNLLVPHQTRTNEDLAIKLSRAPPLPLDGSRATGNRERPDATVPTQL